MASGLIFNPIHLLHAVPLATSTATLAHALLELLTNNAFLLPSIRKESETVLPTWYDRVFNRAVWTVVTLNMGTISSAAATLYLDGQQPQLQTTKFYSIGLACAIGHLLFVPFVAGLVQRIVEQSRLNAKPAAESRESKESATEAMAKWLSVHRVRMLVADLPAWLAFVAAVATL